MAFAPVIHISAHMTETNSAPRYQFVTGRIRARKGPRLEVASARTEAILKCGFLERKQMLLMGKQKHLMTDAELERKLGNLKRQIKSWAEHRDLWEDFQGQCGFSLHDDFFEEAPSENPGVLVLHVEAGLHRCLWGCADDWRSDIGWDEMEELDAKEISELGLDPEEILNTWKDDAGPGQLSLFPELVPEVRRLEEPEDVDVHGELSEIIYSNGFEFEFEEEHTMVIHTAEETLRCAYKDYFDFRWICRQLTPDFGDIYAELYSYFAKHPESLYRLNPRMFEILLSEVFRNQGFRTEIGPGWADGGIDIRLWQKRGIGDVLTLVQAKRYHTKNPIRLEVVAALRGIVEDSKAGRGILVTTSRFLPSARRFASRQRKRIKLATSMDVSRWCEDINRRLQKHSIAVQVGVVVDDLRRKGHKAGLVGRIVHATWGVTMVMNTFCLIVRESEKAVLMVKLPAKCETQGSEGYEIPILPNVEEENSLRLEREDNVVRATKHGKEPNLTFWGDRKSFSVWDGKPKYYNHCD